MQRQIALAIVLLSAGSAAADVWGPNIGSDRYRNVIIFSDQSGSDGKVWLVNAFARIRAGTNSVLHVAEMRPGENRIVLAQGDTDINGPHQGAWIELVYPFPGTSRLRPNRKYATDALAGWSAGHRR